MNEEINALIERGNSVLAALGYTEHSRRHAAKVAERAGEILNQTGYSAHEAELAKIAGYMHDIGNSVIRHSPCAERRVFGVADIAGAGNADGGCELITAAAIGHHDEGTGTAVQPVSAALILADKTDVRRNRVQNPNQAAFDIHDRVNYAALSSVLEIHQDKKVIEMKLELDDTICTVLDYFAKIFLQRMLMCRRAAEVLGYQFKLYANGSKLC